MAKKRHCQVQRSKAIDKKGHGEVQGSKGVAKKRHGQVLQGSKGVAKRRCSEVKRNKVEFHGNAFFAGACRENPGNGSIGVVIYNAKNNNVIEQFSEYLGSSIITSNVAHYRALIAALQHALNHGITHLTVYGHSELICKQVKT